MAAPFGTAPRAYRAVEFFCGGGLVGLGASQAGMEVALANDICPQKGETYRANFPDVPFDGRSIEDLRASDLKAVDIYLGSSPCKDHSINNFARLGFEGERGVMAFHVVRLLHEARALGHPPRVVVFENVPGLLTVNGGGDLASLCQGVASAGYRLGVFQVNGLLFTAQNRPRVFIVAVRSDIAIPPGLTTRRPDRRWHPKPLQEALKAFPADLRRQCVWWKLPTPAKRQHDLVDLLEHGPEVKLLSEARQDALAARMRPADHARIARAREAGVTVGVTVGKLRGKGDERRRVQEVRLDGHARCLLAGEGHEAQRVLLLDDSPRGFSIRNFTARERARLMGVPDSYKLPPSLARTTRLMGDAVVVPAYAHLLRHLVRPLCEAGEPPALPATGRSFPCRARKEAGEDGRIRSPRVGVKGATTTNTVYALPRADERIKALARKMGVPVSELFLRGVDALLAQRGEAPLERYVPQPRRGGGRPRPGGRRPAPRARPAAGGARPKAAQAPVHVPVQAAAQDPAQAAALQPPAPEPPAQVLPEPMPRRQARRDGRGGGARARLADACTPCRYPGGKARAADRILHSLGRARTLVEPFAGGASVSVRALLTGMADRAVLAERDLALRALLETVAAGTGPEFEALCRLVGREAQPTRAWWGEFLRGMPAEGAPGWLLGGFALLATRYHWRGVGSAGLVSDAELARHWRGGTMERRLRALRGQRARLEVRADAFEAIREFGGRPGAAFFVDPPYTLGGEQPGRLLYAHHEVDHAALFRALDAVRGRVAATYPENEDVRRLATEHGFRAAPLGIRDGHRRSRQELLLLRDTPGRAVR